VASSTSSAYPLSSSSSFISVNYQLSLY